mmetsp:Transcript_5254/g.15296  ORF Transcript_5254/g.15296 Transcript_5254/m.15296 type:complete len:97 (-) Transcript_5254:7151-7441(-)
MEIFDSSLLRINLDLEDKKKAILLLADAIEQETLNCRAEVEKLEALCEAHMRTAGEQKQFELTKGLLKVDALLLVKKQLSAECTRIVLGINVSHSI